MVFGIEGRSVVGNLRNVVSWYTLVAGVALLGVCLSTGLVSAQDDTPPTPQVPAGAEKPAEAPPASNPAPATAPKAAAVIYAEARITEADIKKWNSTRSLKFSSAQKSIAPTSAETKELIDGANLFVDKMTIPKFRVDLHRYVIEPARRSVEGQLTLAKPREILLKAITDRSLELLKATPPHHPDVELGIVILLSTMNAQVAGTNTAAVPFTGSAKALITVLEDPRHPLQSRIMAAKGLGRMGLEAVPGIKGGDLSVVQRGEIATSLAKVLLDVNNSGGTEDGKLWYRWRLAEALGDCGMAYDLNKGSGYIDVLLAVATNPKENLGVRAVAMRAVTQLAWDAQVNVPLILSETLKLQVEIANQYNAAVMSKKLVSAELHHANLNLYFAFQPETAQQVTLMWGLRYQTKRAGLNQYTPLATSAYDVLLPAVNHIASRPKASQAALMPPALIAALQSWIDANPPQNRKPTAASPNPLP